MTINVRPESLLEWRGNVNANPVAGKVESRGPRATAQGPTFAAVLEEQMAAPVRFSGHAQQRLATRAIRLDGAQMTRLAGAMNHLAEKGGRTSLVMLDQVAMVVSIPSRTVITAVTAGEQSVFTNIDSAIRA